jgi:hypothetical protein
MGKLRNLYSSPNIMGMINSVRVRWTGYAAWLRDANVKWIVERMTQIDLYDDLDAKIVLR